MKSVPSTPTPPRQRLRVLAPAPLVVALAAWMTLGSRVPPSPPSARSEALVSALRERGLSARAEDVRFVDPPRGALASRIDSPRAVVLARRGDGPDDVFLVRTRLSPEGALLAVGAVHELTRTSAASESGLAVHGAHAAWSVGDGARVYRVELADLAGEPDFSGDDWTPLARAEHALTNLQHTGQLRGVGRRSFRLDPAARSFAALAGDDSVELVADDHHIVIPWDPGGRIQGERYLREEDRTVARPGNLITWAVDRARDLPWFGDERMQLLKAVVYALLDRADRALGVVRAPEAPAVTTDELGTTASETPPPDPETGWPPAPAGTLMTPALPDEGRWFRLDHDPFVRTTLAVPVPLVTTYLRADATRLDSRVLVVAWDPRQVELDVVPGTEEPQSATSEPGSGLIPRDPEVMTRLVAAFNGAFQSTHGDFGMMAQRSLLVPPKPYAATVARLRSGATAFGTWPGDATVPDDVVSFRQNLTPLVSAGVLNQYRRDWWGGVPQGWEDETRTVRSGLCLTRDGFVAYFYGTKIDHVRLGEAMLAVRCEYGMHLDMNQGHTGLEVYQVDRAERLPLLTDKLDGQWKAQGDVAGLPGHRFRGRRLFRSMQLMNFPRYVRRGARDFFYLAVRPLLPREPLQLGAHEADEGTFHVDGLPQHGWPPALATAAVRPATDRPDTKVRVLEVDLTQLRAATGGETAPTVLAIDPIPPASPESVSACVKDGRATLVAGACPQGSVPVATGSAEPRGATAAAVGADAHGLLVYAEVTTAADPARDGALLAAVLADAGCTGRTYLAAPLGLSLGGTRDLADHPRAPAPGAARWVRGTPPGAERLFPGTPIVPPSVWKPLQRATRPLLREDGTVTPP